MEVPVWSESEKEEDELGEEIRPTQEGENKAGNCYLCIKQYGKSDCFVCMATTSAFLTLRTRQRDTHYLCFF